MTASVSVAVDSDDACAGAGWCGSGLGLGGRVQYWFDAHAEHVGSLRIAHFFDADQQNDLARCWRKPGQRALQVQPFGYV